MKATLQASGLRSRPSVLLPTAIQALANRPPRLSVSADNAVRVQAPTPASVGEKKAYVLFDAAGTTNILAARTPGAARPLGKHTVYLTAAEAQALRATNVKVFADTPLTGEWTGPYGGFPPFDKVKLEDFEPAFDVAIEQNRREIAAIADNPEAPNFANTIDAMQRAGKTLQRIGIIFGIWSSNLSTPEFQKLEGKISPMLSAFQDEIAQNDKLFARIDEVYSDRLNGSLTPEQIRLVETIHDGYVQNGAKLDATTKARVAQINARLSELTTQFAQHEVNDEAKSLAVTDPKELDGLPQELVDAAAAEAERNGHKGEWFIQNTRSAMEPLLTYAKNRSVREKAFRMWTSRGDNGDENDNNAIVTEILKLRTERAQLLGAKSHAAWALQGTMAKTPDAALDLMMKIWKPAVERAHTEVAEMQAIVDAEKGGFKIAPWDYRFYAEKVRKAKFDLDLTELKPYLEVNNLREAMFASAKKLYGFTFKKVDEVPVFQPDVTVYEVFNADGTQAGLWYFDPYARQGKASGAWMNAYREQYKRDGKNITTIVSNNANFIKGKPGERTTVSWDDADTMFHEFGHALHGLCSNVTYPSLSGTNLPRDYVEFPSQFNENYLLGSEALKYLVNEKGEKIPQTLLDKIEKAKTFRQGFDTVELLASAIVDMKLHITTDPVEPHAFEKQALAELGMPEEIVMRHRIPHFGHIFGGGYDAGYYGYPWSEVLDHDAFEAFTESGDIYDPATAARMKSMILSIGNTVDPAVAYRNFRGRDANVDALLRARGFPVNDNAAPVRAAA